MSLVLNMVGGGGGGSLKDTDAILIVTVPTGSTVTMTKGGVTLTPTMWAQAADPTLDCALFVISPSLFDSVNAWTVTATLRTDTALDTVIIDAAAEYDIVLSYGVVYLFNNGNQCITVTGGWVDGAKATSGYIVAPVTISTAIGYGYPTDDYQSFAATKNKIALYKRDIIRVKCSFTGKFSIYVLSRNATDWDGNYILAEYVSTTTSETVHNLAITSNMSGYVLIGAYGQSAIPVGSGSISKALIVRS